MSKTNGTKPMPQRQRLAALRKERESGRGRSTEPGSAGPITDTAVVATTPGTGPKKRSGLLWELATVPKQPARERPLSAPRTSRAAPWLPGGHASANRAVGNLLRGHEGVHRRGCSTATGSGRRVGPGGSAGPGGSCRASCAAGTGGWVTGCRASVRLCGTGNRNC